jgi:hypothetical protein
MALQTHHITTQFTQSAGAAKVVAWEEDRVAFFKAARRNDTAALDAIITKYPQEWKQWKDKTGSALRCAQASDSLDAFKLLIERGANKNENYNEGWNPILTAYKKNQKQFFDYLLETGADLNETGTIRGMMSRETSLLHMAVLRKDKDTLIRLIEHGALTSVTASTNLTIFGDWGPAAYCATPEAVASKKKLFVFADILKRASVIRADYVTAQAKAKAAPAPFPPPAPVVAPDPGKIDVMSPVQLKKPGGP